MNEPIGNELATDELFKDEPTMDEPDVEETAMDGPAKEEISVDKALHVSPRQRWSDAGSELTRPTTAAQVKARLNTYYPSQANLHAFVEYIEDLDAKFGPRTRIREAGRFQKSLAILLWICVALFHGFKGSLSLGHLLASFCMLIIYINIFEYLKEYSEEQHELEENPETDRLQKFESLMVETLRHRQLEILCRYGDYLAERLGTLRQHISEKKLEIEHKLSEYWTETSATLREEERQETAPCHNLIRTAAQGLNWKKEVTIFMVHEYAKRNNLMHAELFNLVNRQDWYAIEQRCKKDIETLRELFIDLDPNSKATIENWVQIIEEFRDRWVRQSKDGSTWEARSIIQEAIVAGVDDRASLNKLAMLPKDATPTERDKAINTIKNDNALKKAQRNKTQQQADAALQADNRLLQAEVEKLKKLLESRGASEDFLAKVKADVKRNDELEKKNKQYQKRIKQLEGQCAASKTQERALKKTIQDSGVAEKTNIGEKNTDTGEKNIDNGEKNMDVGEKDSNTGEKNTDTEDRNTIITDNRADSGAIE